MGRGFSIRDSRSQEESVDLLKQYEFASSQSVKNIFGLLEPLKHELTLSVLSVLSSVGDEKKRPHLSSLFIFLFDTSRSC